MWRPDAACWGAAFWPEPVDFLAVEDIPRALALCNGEVVTVKLDACPRHKVCVDPKHREVTYRTKPCRVRDECLGSVGTRRATWGVWGGVRFQMTNPDEEGDDDGL